MALKYNVGDKVRINSLDWYNRQKNETEVKWKYYSFSCHMTKYCGQIMTISIVGGYSYSMIEDDGAYSWTDEMIEGLVEEENLIERVDDNGLPFNEWLSHKGFFYVPDGYELKDENGNVINARKIVLEKKEYPKTYEECCYVLGFENTELVFEDDYRDINPPKEQWKRLGLMNQLNKLLICRDAYWKIAGEEMGLEKSWEADWNDEKQDKYGFYNEVKYTIINSALFVFPTEEMRDAFYDNFKELIETIKN